MGNDTNKPGFSDAQPAVRLTAKEAPEAKPDRDARSEAASSVDEGTIYAVESGDSLSKIAKHFCAGASVWKQVLEVNRDQLTDPDRIKPGQMLKIPAKS